MKFLDKLISETKSGVFQWEYLDDYENISEQLYYIDGSTPLDNAFDLDTSFILLQEQSNTLLLLIQADGGSCVNYSSCVYLSIVPTTYKNPLFLTDEGYGEQLTRLHNAIKHQFPGPEDFIDFLLEN